MRQADYTPEQDGRSLSSDEMWPARRMSLTEEERCAVPERSGFKREITLGDVSICVAVIVAMAAAWIAWFQLRGLARRTRPMVLLHLDERWASICFLSGGIMRTFSVTRALKQNGDPMKSNGDRNQVDLSHRLT
jgi:hypothetical protein